MDVLPIQKAAKEFQVRPHSNSFLEIRNVSNFPFVRLSKTGENMVNFRSRFAPHRSEPHKKFSVGPEKFSPRLAASRSSVMICRLVLMKGTTDCFFAALA
jgi:hypothetical protein